MLRRSLALALLLAASSTTAASAQSATADAPESTERILNLVDGAIYRGELLEYVPKSHVLLRLTSGESKRFPWNQVKRLALVASTSSTVPLQRKPEPKPTQLAPPPAITEQKSTLRPVAAGPGAGPAVVLPPDLETAYQAHLRRAKALYEDDDLAKALDEYEAAYRIAPKPALLFPMARINHRIGRIREAAERYQQALKEDGAMSHERRAQLLGYLGQLGSGSSATRAESQLPQTSALPQVETPVSPPSATVQGQAPSLDQAELLFREGSARYRQEEYLGALELYTQSYQLSPAPLVLYAIGRANQRLGRYAEAYQSYDAYSRAEPGLEPGRRAELDERMAEMLRKQKAVERLSPDLKQRPADFSFVSFGPSKYEVKLQLLTDSFSADGWGWYADIERWKTLCTAPCERVVPTNGTYRLDGPDIAESPKFSLPRRNHDVDLKIKPGSYGLRALSWVTMFTGMALNVVGVSIGLSMLSDSATSTPSPGGSATANAAIGLSLGGLVGMLGSIPLFLVSRTRVATR